MLLFSAALSGLAHACTHVRDQNESNTSHYLWQIIDDILDFTGTAEVLGKPAMADVSLVSQTNLTKTSRMYPLDDQHLCCPRAQGLATAPVLYAAQDCRELRPIIKRRFKEPGDAELAYDLVMKTNGVVRAQHLAVFHAQVRSQSKLRQNKVYLAHTFTRHASRLLS